MLEWDVPKVNTPIPNPGWPLIIKPASRCVGSFVSGVRVK